MRILVDMHICIYQYSYLIESIHPTDRGRVDQMYNLKTLPKHLQEQKDNSDFQKIPKERYYKNFERFVFAQSPSN